MVKSKMTFNLFLLLLIAAFSLPLWACAQGLKGAPSGFRPTANSPALLKGSTDDERWTNFSRAQKTLIGMTRNDVIKLFGPCSCANSASELAYRLTQEKLPSRHGELSYLELTVKLANSKVIGYCIHAVYWG